MAKISHPYPISFKDEGITVLNEKIDLVYNDYDNVYYFLDFSENKHSIDYPTRLSAMSAFAHDAIKWSQE